jgi:pimeloyl-ACP methyl ester carboxylesterase
VTLPARVFGECPLTSTSLPRTRAVRDDAAMAGASGTQAVAAADGRTLTIAEWGDPDGFPVFSLHGTPGSRFVGQANASAYADVGARVITYDRPGYGGSDRFRGRRLVDCVADVSAAPGAARTAWRLPHVCPSG